MRQAIETRYAGPTDHRGSRVLVRSQARRMVVPWDDALDVQGNHRAAAMAMVRKLGWGSEAEWHGGATANGAGYVFVHVVRPVEDLPPLGPAAEALLELRRKIVDRDA